MTATVDAAETAFSELLLKVQAGDTVIITSGEENRPVAKLGALPQSAVSPRRLGFFEDLKLDIPDSFFFDPLPEQELKLWVSKCWHDVP